MDENNDAIRDDLELVWINSIFAVFINRCVC
jgi:hypothetical protein